jgi:hypothetical protein
MSAFILYEWYDETVMEYFYLKSWLKLTCEVANKLTLVAYCKNLLQS